MSGTLYVVATPIGNLEDITLRALRTMREVDVIAAEDTRRTAKLLNHHGISTSTVSFHAHNTRSRLPELLARLRRGESVALVSDAGTPLLSDPGLELVGACIEAGITIEPIPGASAPLSALVVSGFPAHPVTFLGFAPSRANERIAWLKELAAIPHTVVFFEAPHRVAALLKNAADILGNRLLLVARELTKLHQAFHRGTASQLVDSPINMRGEFTVVVGPRQQMTDSQDVTLDLSQVVIDFRHMTDNGRLTRRQAISELARRYGRSSREIYAALEEAKRSLP
jgi:16S rRNA (cytidine1402-2'-O)-methyltransferase